MSKTSKWLLGVGVSAVSIAWYIAAPVSHTIDVVRVEVAGIREARESLVTLIYTGLGPKKQQVFEKTVEMPRGVAEFYDVPEGNYTVRIATDRCYKEPYGFTTEKYEAYFDFGGRGPRWEKPKRADVDIDLDKCARTMSFEFASSAWKWGF